MSVKVFQTNKAGKIEFTRYELEKLLNETYNEGYCDGENHAKSNYWTWTTPSITNVTGPTFRTTISDISTDSATTTIAPLNTSIDNTVLCKYSEAKEADNKSVTDIAPAKIDTATATAITTASKGTDAPKKISVQTHGEVKNGKADVNASVSMNDATPQTYEFKGMPFTSEDVLKTLNSILEGKYDINSVFGIPQVNSAKKATPFDNLAKELRNL